MSGTPVNHSPKTSFSHATNGSSHSSSIAAPTPINAIPTILESDNDPGSAVTFTSDSFRETDPLRHSSSMTGPLSRAGSRSGGGYGALDTISHLKVYDSHTHSGTHSPRNSVIFNPESYLMANHAAALPSHVYQKLHRQSIISVTPSPHETLSRMENLQEMRPFHLVGLSMPICDWEEYRKPDEFIDSLKNKELQNFYIRQNEIIDRYIEIDRMLDSGLHIDMLREYGSDLAEIQERTSHQTNSEDSSSSTKVASNLTSRQGVPGRVDEESAMLNGGIEQSNLVMFAIYVNFAINIVLLIGKIVVTLLTNSLSVIASLIDSVLDFLSTAIIWVSTRLVDTRDWRTKHLYPVGRSRLEPIGVLVFSILIIISFLQVGEEAVQRLLWGEREVVEIGIFSIAIMAITVVAKFFCYIWCNTIESSAVEALAQDALTDVVFNTFSIVVPALGHYFNIWWLDPLGALFLSCYISWSWGETALEHIENLTGAAADAEDRQVLLYLCARFADTIKQITALNAYHSGDRLTVEVDIVLEAKSSLRDSHDIGEALQYALETLPFVERAFVHLDYRTGNFTGHLLNS